MAFAFGATPNPDKSEKVGKENEDSSSEIHRIDEAAQQQEIARIGRQLSQLSSRHGGSPTDIFDQDSESPLNPHSASFNGRKWLKAMLDLGAPETQRTAGVSFRNLSAYGFGSDSDWQKTVGNIPLTSVGALKGLFGFKGRRIQILDGFDGLLLPGELLTVLGPPGSGCSSLLKTLAGDTHGFEIDANSSFNYSGIDYATFHSRFAGESVYSAEVEVLSVGDTLRFAAYARSPRTVPGGIDRWEYSNHMAAAIMSMLGISHTWNTRVGNDLIRGVSGGERKRVSIAEVMLAGAPLQMWDNSTRGLDSANAIEFVKSLRTSAEITGSAAAVAIYQAPGAAYDCFDKVTVLYSGRQIYFGPTLAARDFFIDMGFECPTRQTTADFLTSLTSPAERVVRQGFEGRVPNTPDEFAARWKASETYAQLIRDIDAYNDKHPIGGPTMDAFKAARRAHQGRGTRASSPFTLSYADQIKLCTTRGFWRLKGDPSLTLTQIIGNSVMQLIISSVFYNLRPTTASFYSRGALLFFAILLAAFASALEILTLYAQMRTCQAQSTARPHADSSQRQRPIIEKHHRYAFTRPSAEAWASVICDLPYKTLNCITSNLILYFMTNLRRTPGSFFFFLFVSYLTTLVMSGFFRSVASLSRSLSQALTPAAVVILGLVMYSGFAVPYPTMLGWSSWIFRINPVAYAFELLAINEFDGRDFECSNFVPSGPGYEAVGGLNRACVAVGAVPGSTVVSGTAYINTSFQYYGSHRGRNIGILFAFLIFFMTVYIAATELISAKRSKGEVLVFRQGHQPAKAPTDIESRVGPDEKGPQSKSQADIGAVIAKQTAVFSFEDICFDVQIKKENRRILDHVDGYVKPGTLTALMGVSGAGKTSLLDALATRTTMGVLSGEALVDGRPRDASFQRKTGYVQQQDLHLETTTVREALIFSAVLRQPAHLSRKEKVDYVDEVIRLLEMEEYADAVVGVPGEGLNVEQRKRLTIGVELAAKPELLLFLDEPTSGLDSQTAWAICDLMEKLAKSGQSILCTIHQPSAMLFQRFDRLLFLAKGGKTVYFGDIGKNSRTLVDYFEGNGAPACPPEANPAEWILEAIGAAPGSSTTIDWHATWNRSPEKADVKRHLAELKEERPKITRVDTTSANKAAYREFAASYLLQWREVQYRVFQQYWRTPTYIAAKTVLCVACALFIGFTFYAPNAASLTQQAVQNQLYSIMLFTIFGQLVQQIMPHFVVQRSLYEARERPSKVYSWFIFMISNIFVELPYATLVAILVFACWYFSVGFYSNAAVTSTQHTRALTFQLFLWLFFLFQSTFTHMCIAAITNAEEGGNIANLLFALSLIFCGVLATPSQFPGFWIWMYRVSPFTYFTEGFLTVGLADTPMACSNAELTRFAPPAGQTCATYLETFFTSAPGAIVDPSSTTECAYCAYTNTNEQLAQLNLSFANRWRDFGLLWIYILFNIAAACALYYLVRVPRPKMEETTKPEPTIESDAGSSQRSEKV